VKTPKANLVKTSYPGIQTSRLTLNLRPLLASRAPGKTRRPARTHANTLFPQTISAGLAALTLLAFPESRAAAATTDLVTVATTAISGTSGDDALQSNSVTNSIAILNLTTNVSDGILTLATGMDGLAGNDQVGSGASLGATAQSSLDIGLRYSAAEADAISVGIAGGTGVDSLTNQSTLNATASSSSVIGDFLMQIDVGATGWPALAHSDAAGLDGGADADTIVNNGPMTVHADSFSRVNKGRIGTIEIPVNFFGFGDASVTADAVAVGLRLGTNSATGTETALNNGLLTVSANATSTTRQVIAELLGAARVDDVTTARSLAQGIAGSATNDLLHNTARINVGAASEAEIRSAEFKMKGLMTKGAFDLFGFDVGQFNTIAESTAQGLAGEAGDDLMLNSGTNALVNATAEAAAISTSITLAVSPPISLSAASMVTVATTPAALAPATNNLPAGSTYGDADTKSIAAAQASAGGAGHDTMLNSGTQTATAIASASSVGVNADVSFSSSSYVPIPGAAIVDTATSANAIAATLDGGSGDDVVVNSGRLDAVASAGSSATTVGATVKGTMEGIATGVTVIDAASEALATARGIRGALGSDSITNTGTIYSTAAARADSLGIGVTATGAKVGMAFGVALGDSSATSRASAFGIDAGDSQETNGPAADTVWNSGTIAATAGSTNSALSIVVDFQAALQGVVGGVAAGNSDATADAVAVGIQTGEGDDIIYGGGGTLNSSSAARGESDSVVVTVSGAWEGVALGAALAKASTGATATSTGVDSGNGNDVIVNRTGLNNTAVADGEADVVSVAVSGAWMGAAFGVSLADGRTEADATATAIAGGSGHDSITNAAPIVNRATANAEAQTISITAAVAIKGASAGLSFARGGAEATAAAVGIAAGSGNDSVLHTNLLTVDSIARTKVNTVAITVATVGAAMAEASSKANSTATGIEGDGGHDWLKNEGGVAVLSHATVDGDSTAANLFGYASGDVALTNSATAIGISGGTAGEIETLGDTILNANGATVTVSQVAGVAFADTRVIAGSASTGLGSGALADLIVNNGTVNVGATSHVSVANSIFQLGGIQSATAGINATSTGTGISAGDGQNVITNGSAGTISTYAWAKNVALDMSGSVLGAQILRTGSDAAVTSRGILAGNGADTIGNYGHIAATANSDGHAGAVALGLFSLTFAGSLSHATVEGINGGGNNDWIGNWGTISVGALRPGDEALATAHTTAVSIDFFAYAMTTLGATADARGINGEGGDDFIWNAGSIEVGRSNQWLASGTSFGFGGQVLGSANTYALGFGTANATGIAGGAGADTMINDTNGAITVHARAHSDVDTESYEVFSAIFPSAADAAADATATATGIQGGAGNDWAANAGTITARAYAFADAQSLSTLDIDIATWSFAETSADPTATALGMDLGSGQNLTENSGSISARSQALAKSYAHADATFEAATSDAAGRPVAIATGITAGDGANTVVNTVATPISVEAVAATTNGNSYALWGGAVVANSDDGRDATAAAGTAALPLLAQATGIGLGSGSDVVTNHGTITVAADTLAWSHANTHVWYRYPTAVAKAYGTASAQGIAPGDGNNIVVNTGGLTANASADATPYASAFSRDYGPTARATGNATATASGLRVGNGNNLILNDGNIQVTAAAHAWAYAFAEENAGGIRTERAEASATAQAATFGILTGNGNNHIVNNGSITASARASATANAVTEDGDVQIPTTSVSAAAVGIQTGSGNDRVINAGSILATNFSSSGSGYGIAISTGAGDDTVSLLNNSLVRGAVLLGDGSDALELAGTFSHSGAVNGGAGTDTILLAAAGHLNGDCLNFERLVKTGAGTFTLDRLSSMHWLEIQEGALLLNDNYRFGSNCTYVADVGRDGSYGECQIMGAADLGGTLLVRRGRGAYTNATYDLIEAGSMTNRFAQEILPAPTRLLRFEVNYLFGAGQSVVQAEAVAGSFTTVASNRLEHDIAQHLDAVLPLAQGDFSDVLGEFQTLNDSQYAAAFASFSPANYDAASVATFSGAREYHRVLQQHLQAGRDAMAFSGPQTRVARRPQLFASAKSPQLTDAGSRLLSRPATTGPAAWIGGVGRWDDLEASDGFPGFNYSVGGTTLGFDYTPAEQFLVGLAAAYTSSRLDLGSGQGHGEIESYTGSIYATRRFAQSYLEGAVSYGRHRYDNDRHIQVGALERIAQSEHDGNAVSALVGGGTTFSAQGFEFQPHASLLYTWLDEDGFQEFGADSLNMRVAGRDTHSLKSEFGLRLARPIPLNQWVLIPEIGVAWEHDFDVDERAIVGAFGGAPGSAFSINGQDLATESTAVHGGVTLLSRGGFSTSLSYDGLFNGSRARHGVSGLIRILF
jgi:uncharacterized protein YhjY with autotransporter beta-barrel domain